ncbi:hypothetical protein NIES593_21170 [Hydrococcus rivularis NIES-593]|uniref:DUF3386 domain-containing protein n=1 Tax=Hydrococcus rivularis NIES-593 TaxID=1921803 RepID=A0A1U7H8D7_9CYAN|nr:DUF3386 domain-containing protein [Hydrococcus rivularis]OKH19153.1 hypothetical protein NIES593_21170 [Hydrococcus rivularis NIES-593]
MTQRIEARDLFRAAYENRYTWEKNFPGYTADITFRRGDEVFRAKVRVNPDLSGEVFDIADEQAKKEIHGQLWETAIHRIRRTFEETHGKNTFSYGDIDETGAVEILVGGKSQGDRYKVRNNEVCHVHRHIHGVVVTIDTFSSHDTGEGYLSHRYDSIYRDPKTGEVKAGRSKFEDNYEKIGKYYILTSRVIQTEENGQTVTREFSFSNVKLLEPAVV